MFFENFLEIPYSKIAERSYYLICLVLKIIVKTLQEKLEKSYYTLQVQVFLGHSITHWAIFCVSLKIIEYRGIWSTKLVYRPSKQLIQLSYLLL